MDYSHHHQTPQLPIQPTALPAAPYSTRPPSPPYIHIPAVSQIPTLNNANTPWNPLGATSAPPQQATDNLMTIHPSPAAIYNHTPAGTSTSAPLTPADLAAITRNLRPQTARDPTNSWVYEARRAAQPVLDYLYLGPASVVRDRAFLVREGITMVLVARDARFAALSGSILAGLKRSVEGTGVRGVEVVDVADGRELVGAFSTAVGVVNGHLLAVGRDKAPGEEGGKVLVCCETGNERSAAIVAAYLMAMFGLDTVQAVQFMLLQRFCVTMGEDVKNALQAYGYIIRAREDVGKMAAAQGHGRQGGAGGGSGFGAAGVHAKRRIEETSGDGEDGEQDGMMGEMDEDRYAGRDFAPFVER